MESINHTGTTVLLKLSKSLALTFLLLVQGNIPSVPITLLSSKVSFPPCVPIAQTKILTSWTLIPLLRAMQKILNDNTRMTTNGKKNEPHAE